MSVTNVAEEKKGSQSLHIYIIKVRFTITLTALTALRFAEVIGLEICRGGKVGETTHRSSGGMHCYVLVQYTKKS